MALSPRAEAIAARITALGAHIHSKITTDEAAHDAANEAAHQADEDAIEQALVLLEGALGADPTPANVAAPPIPAAGADA